MQKLPDAKVLFSPTDLANFLGCSYSSILDLRELAVSPEAHQLFQRDADSESDELLRRKGDEHEAGYLRCLRNEGRVIFEIPKDASLAEQVRLTNEAMQSGAEVIYQATLLDANWRGYADFLLKTPKPSDLGNYSYEVADTKLALSPQVKHVVQIVVYSLLLTTRQLKTPEQCHLVLGDGMMASFAVNDFTAYVRRAMSRLEIFASGPPVPIYPEPCSHCANCHWQQTCEAKWIKDDHLSLVANIQRTQVRKLEKSGIRTLAELAASAGKARIPSLNPRIYQRLSSQAALQEHKQRSGKNKVEVIPSEPGQGFDRLPQPNPGDLFFDMEGDPFHPQGLEYLFGIAFSNAGKLEYKAFWAHNSDEERNALAQVMEFFAGHLKAYPDAYIYHYNHYETTALKRLSGRYGVAENLLDHLLRGMKFVDLYRVVREGIRVSEPGYSIKNLEVFYMEQRQGEVASAGDSIVVYHKWRESCDDKLLEQIAEYNAFDCRSTAKLQDWLVQLRPPATNWFNGPPPVDDISEPASNTSKGDSLYTEYRNKLLDASHPDEAFRHRLADLLEFHSREEKPEWWAIYDRQNRLEEELLDDAECIAGLKAMGSPYSMGRSSFYSFRYPAQESKRKVGDSVIDVATLKGVGTIEQIDEARRIVVIGRAAHKGPLPERLNIGPGKPVETEPLRKAIYRFAKDVLDGTSRYSALRDILEKALPKRQGDVPVSVDRDLLASTLASVLNLDNSYLFVQGPPGAGKTYTCAHVIVQLIRHGKRVGVAANSHQAIQNLLRKIEELADQQGVKFSGINKSSSGYPESVFEGKFIRSKDKIEYIPPTILLLSGTAWLFADQYLDQFLDYLFIDEAGQVSTANVVAMGTAAKNIVLVGDQMQLSQPIQGSHPGEAGLSILEFLLGHQSTVDPEQGIFLNQTHRLHPSICRFISEAFYDGRLASFPGNENRTLVFDTRIDGIPSQGIHVLPVNHEGCSQKSEEEAEVLKTVFEKLLGQSFTEKDGKSRALTVKDILVVSPFNVQVNHLKSVLPTDARVGTVDKFQGQEAPVVLVSMVTSDAECMPRNLEFLFSPNRLNVALSRAQCLAIVAINPKLLETPCKTVDQMKLVNTFCKLFEFGWKSPEW
jgi:uncharacterized protein